MDLQDFINELTCTLERNKYKLLLHDIIDIYEGSYNDYYNYVDTMKRLNARININSQFGVNIDNSIYYEPEHNILEEWQYNYLVRLKGDKNG